jgi:hypothetical protein
MAEAISNGLGGAGVALLDGSKIAIDSLSASEIGAAQIQSLVKSYLSTRKDAAKYRVEGSGNLIVVHSSIQVSEKEKKTKEVLPPGLLQCPTCGYLATSQNQYEDHLRIHDLMRGIAR